LHCVPTVEKTNVQGNEIEMCHIIGRRLGLEQQYSGFIVKLFVTVNSQFIS
jgi:hypothetical protein